MTRHTAKHETEPAAATATPYNAGTTGDPAASDGVAESQSMTKADYEHLAQVRHALRLFARQTELELRRYKVSPQQYLLLLALKGFPGRETANITELAERLQIRHNAVIGLVNRAEDSGLVKRLHDPDAADRRIVHVKLTYVGERLLSKMVESLRAERTQVRDALTSVYEPRPDQPSTN